ncbi:MAG TPA: glycosyltransferase [Nitrospiria bacterium]|nr:glycosyltransferase [Nitrospiria bacterium]
MRGLSEYNGIAEPDEIRLLTRLGERLRGRSFLHVNSTSVGGGVAEILHRLIALFGDLGVSARWEVIKGDQSFFEVTKQIHNGLQGQAVEMSPRMWEIHREVNEANAGQMDLDADLVFIHDPQPVHLIEHRRNGLWVWRCHVDVSHPHPPVWRGLAADVGRYDAAIFSGAQFAQQLAVPQFVVPPSIDPLSEKNRDLSDPEIQAELEAHQIPRDKPILLQVSRFDRFKDPVGVVQAYRMVKRYYDCRLILAGGTATDDPEGEGILARVREEARDDPDIRILLLPPFSDRLINALQRAAAVVLQKSTREGFGLTVAEALWKAKPVIGGAVGGIPSQIHHGVTGFLVHSVEGAAYRIRHLLHNPGLGKKMGEMGREHVRRNFLITRQAKDYLALWAALEHRGERVIQI